MLLTNSALVSIDQVTANPSKQYKYIDATADIAIDEDGVGPTFKIGVKAEKVNDAVSGNLK